MHSSHTTTQMKQFLWQKGSANAEAQNGSIVSKVVQVHDRIGEQYFVVLLGLRWKLYSKFRSTGGPFQEDTVMYVNDPSDFQFEVIEDVILDGWTVATSKARTQDAFLAVISLHRVQNLIVFSQHLDQCISTAVIGSSHEPASYSQSAQCTSTCICHCHFVLHAWHVLQTTPSWEDKYLQCRVAVATSCPNNFNLPSKGRLHTHTARDRQSDVSLMQPFLLATLKLGSVSEIVNQLAASQKQQKILSRQSCSWSSRQYRPYSLPEPTLASLSS